MNSGEFICFLIEWILLIVVSTALLNHGNSWLNEVSFAKARKGSSDLESFTACSYLKSGQ
uniref:Uncharacterized protein n=1 Tax=Chryseobacterium endophyticum TaxID=1854762 RepID=A0AAU6WMS7_9FLAO